MLTPNKLMLKSPGLRLRFIRPDAQPSLGNELRVQFNDEKSLGRVTYQNFCNGIAVTTSVPIPSPFIEDPQAQFDDISLRLSPYNAPLLPHAEDLIATFQNEIQQVGKVFVSGPAATDLFTFCAIVHACARLGCHQLVQLLIDQNAFQVPTNNDRTRDAYQQRFRALLRTLSQITEQRELDLVMAETPIAIFRKPKVILDTLLGNELGVLAGDKHSDTMLIAQSIAMARSGSIPHVQRLAEIMRMKYGKDAQKALRQARAASLECLALVKVGGTASHLNQAESVTRVALSNLEKTSRTSGKGVALSAVLYNHLALISVKRAILQGNKALLRTAKSELRTAIALASQASFPDMGGLRYNLLNNCAKLYESEKHFQKALEIIECDFHCEESAAALYRRAVLQLKMGDTNRAFASLDRAWELVPDIHWAWKETLLRARAATCAISGDARGVIHHLELGMELTNHFGAFRRSFVQARALLFTLRERDGFTRHPLVRELQSRSPDLRLETVPPLAIRMPPKLPPYVPEMELWDLTGPSIDDGISQLVHQT